MRVMVLLLLVPLGGCTTYPTPNMRVDYGCRFERENGEADRPVKHAHCYNHDHGKDFVHFEWKFNL